MGIWYFFAPYDKYVEPYIKIAVGDYEKLKKKWGKDDALETYLLCIAHELSHYYQWINELKLTSMGEERQATIYQKKL